MNPNETQIGGSHYRAKLQHWDYAVYALGNRYLEGNITKYVVRHKKKNGTQDLEKAAHYLEKLILEFGQGTVRPIFEAGKWSFPIEEFAQANQLDEYQHRVIFLMANWRTGDNLLTARELIAQMLRASRAADARAEATKAGARVPEGSYPSSKGYVNQD